MRKLFVLLTGVLMSLSIVPVAQAGPGCHNLGDVCDEIVHRPLQVLCSRLDQNCG